MSKPEKNNKTDSNVDSDDNIGNRCVEIVNSFANNELKQFFMALQDEAKKSDDPFALIERCNAVALRSMIYYQWTMIGGEDKESFKNYAYDFVGRFFRVIEILGEPTEKKSQK